MHLKFSSKQYLLFWKKDTSLSNPNLLQNHYWSTNAFKIIYFIYVIYDTKHYNLQWVFIEFSRSNNENGGITFIASLFTWKKTYFLKNNFFSQEHWMQFSRDWKKKQNHFPHFSEILKEGVLYPIWLLMHHFILYVRKWIGFQPCHFIFSA